MDVHEYLKRTSARADSKLSPYEADLRVLYAANASFGNMRNYLRDVHGVTAAVQSIWEFCTRHFSELALDRLSVNLIGPTHEARQSQASSGIARRSLDAHATQSRHQQPGVATTSFRTPEFQPLQTGPVCGVNAPQPLPVVHNATLAPASQTSNVQSSEPRVEDKRTHASNNDPVVNTNESQMLPSFIREPESPPGNIVHVDVPRGTEDEGTVDIHLFGPVGNLRKPHDLNTPAAKERLARFRKAREEGKI